MTAGTPASPVVGIDLGGTNMQLGIVGDQHRIIARAKRKTQAERGQDAVIRRILTAVEELCDKAAIDMGTLQAVGIAAPGAIDIPNGIVLEAPNLGWRDTPLRDLLHEALGCPIAVDNDVNGAIWGEHHLGAARGQDNVLGVWVGTGVGGGLILGGRLYHGDFFTAGEIGQTVIEPEGEPGARTLEDYASRTGMSRIIIKRLPRRKKSMLHDLIDRERGVAGSSKLAKAFNAKDPLAVEVVEHAARVLGIAIANMVTVLSLNRVVIGGGVTEALGQPFIDLIRASFDRDVFPDRCRACELVMTELADDAGLLGAAILAQSLTAACITPRLAR